MSDDWTYIGDYFSEVPEWAKSGEECLGIVEGKLCIAYYAYSPKEFRHSSYWLYKFDPNAGWKVDDLNSHDPKLTFIKPMPENQSFPSTVKLEKTVLGLREVNDDLESELESKTYIDIEEYNKLASHLEDLYRRIVTNLANDIIE